jgi:hypothetical protein
VKLWRIALGAWLILFGLLAITNIRFAQQEFVMGLLAIVAAVFLLFDK